MIFPYEHKLEFIRAKAEVQDRFLQAIPWNRARQTEQGTLEACRTKLREMAELHWGFQKFHPLAESDEQRFLRLAISRECKDLLAHVGQHYPELEGCRDSLLREMVGDTVEEPGIANPSTSASLKHVGAETVPTKPAEPPDAERSKKGDSRLLCNQNAVNFKKAEEYLGITRRGLQKAIKAGKLDVVGGGRNRKVTVESLKRYLPPSDNVN